MPQINLNSEARCVVVLHRRSFLDRKEPSKALAQVLVDVAQPHLHSSGRDPSL